MVDSVRRNLASSILYLISSMYQVDTEKILEVEKSNWIHESNVTQKRNRVSEKSHITSIVQIRFSAPKLPLTQPSVHFGGLTPLKFLICFHNSCTISNPMALRKSLGFNSGA